MKRFFSIIAFIATAIAVTAQTNITEGRRLFYDSRTKTSLCSVPESAFDDGSAKAFEAANPSIRLTYLPIVHLQGTFGYDYVEGTMTLVMPDASEKNDMKARIKWRGASTNGEYKHKRNYSIKFINDAGESQDQKFFGLRNDNHWILDAAQIDMSRVRNRVMTDIWNDFATKPYYFDREPKALTGTRGDFVEVFLNDEYRGIYTLTENMDRKQMKLKKYDETSQTFHGMLWKGGGFANASFWNCNVYDNNKEAWGGLEVKYPDFEDVYPTDHSTMYNAVHFVVNSSDEDFCAHVNEYFDMPVVVDYFLFINAFYALDNCAGKNIFWACYDKQEDKKLTIGVWDLDVTVGQYYDIRDYHSQEVQPDTADLLTATNLYWRLYDLNADKFFQKCRQRYEEVRGTLFSTESLRGYFHRAMSKLDKSGAYTRETKRWSKDSDVGFHELNFEEERKYIDYWIKTRMARLDKDVFKVDGIEEIKEESHPAVRKGTFTLSGQRIPDGQEPPSGIYIRDGKKFIKR